MRPFGVTLVLFYQMLRGLIGIVFGLFILIYVGPTNKFVAAASQGNAVERSMATFGHAAGFVIIGFALLHMVAGYGLLGMQNWARQLTLLYSVIELVLELPNTIHLNLFALVFAPLNALCILYLAMPTVRRAFQAARKQRQMAV